MAERLKILQVNTTDANGGAAEFTWSLFQAFQARGHHAWLAAGHQHTDDPNVLPLPNDEYRNRWALLWISAAQFLVPPASRVWGAGRFRYWLPWIGQPRRILEIQQGREDFDFPATRQIPNLFPEKPDIIHCHNLHGGYFDLRFLPELSREVPVVLSLHDAWLLSGHCAHSFDCERWKTGCGECPDLAAYPSVPRDATRFNWQRKKEIYRQCRLYVTTACRWLMQKVEESILAPAIVESRIISYGVDLSIFHPGDKWEARRILGIPKGSKVLFFVGHGVRQNIWKDYQTLRAAIVRMAERLEEERILFIVLGEEAPTERMDETEIRFIPSRQSREDLVRYYQASDAYIHAARVDTFPLAILEALACGTPVVATGVGGIPEQVKDMEKFGANEGTGILIPGGDAEGMAEGIERLLKNEVLQGRLGENAARDAQKRFDLNRQADDYLTWYGELVHENLHCRKTLI